MLSIITGFLAMVQQTAILLEPDFEQAVFEFDGQGAFRIIPLQMCLILVLFLLSPPTLKAGWRGLKIGLRMRRERVNSQQTAEDAGEARRAQGVS